MKPRFTLPDLKAYLIIAAFAAGCWIAVITLIAALASLAGWL